MVFLEGFGAECRAAWRVMAGKRTYIAAWFVMATALLLSYDGKFTPQIAYSAVLFALGLFAVTFRAAFAAHSAQVLQALTDAAALGQAVRSRNRADELKAASAVAMDTVALDAALRAKHDDAAQTGAAL